MKKQALPRHIQVANYDTEQRQPRYRGNKLIEALPPPLGDVELYEALRFLPEFDASARQWASADRIRELLSLTNLMIPLTAHIQLGHTIDSMMREGYVGRPAMSAAHMGIYQEIWQDEQAAKQGGAGKSGTPFRQTHNTLSPKLSQALVDVSGMGKTTTVQRVLARYPRVIYHADLDLYQIPWLHFEMPSDGGSVKALLIAIIEAIAELIPNNRYFEDYVIKARPSEAALQSSVRRLLNKHCVGLLIPDEVQNAANSRKSDQVVMTELTTLANNSRTPVLYIGTPKARRILSLDLRQGRRALNIGLGDWSPLPRYDIAWDENGAMVQSPGEWVDFMTQLWDYNWLHRQVPLSQELLDVFYFCTQGIIDLAIKLFIVAQARAMVHKTEALTVQLVRAAYEEQFQSVHPMLEAFRSGDRAALGKYEDLELPDTGSLLDDNARLERIGRGGATSVRPGSPEFRARLTSAAQALGISAGDASALAQQVDTEGKAKNLLEATAQLTKKAAPTRSVSSGAKGKRRGSQQTAEAPTYPGIDDRPDDLRHAIVRAATAGTPVVDQMVELGMLKDVGDILCLA